MIALALLFVLIPFVISLFGGCSVDPASAQTNCTSAIGWIALIASWIGVYVAAAGAILIAAEAYVDTPSDWRRSAMAALRKTIPITILTIVTAVLVVVGFILLVVPGIFLTVSLVVCMQALMLEDVSPMEGIRRSWRLVSGDRWRVLGAGLSIVILAAIGFGLIGFIAFLVLSGPTGISDANAYGLVQQILTLLGIPLSTAVGTVIYLDLRVRKEGLEIDELSMRLAR